jgi:glycosyl transferase family 2
MLTLVLAYYMNPLMLAEHYRCWAAYPPELKAQLSVILVDDGSPTEGALDVPRPAGLPTLAIYRVQQDIPWHQHAARNLGAQQAPAGWLLLTDMDHLLTATACRAVLRWIATAPPDGVWTFARVSASALTPYHPHPNSYLLTQQTYWAAGGYDEGLTGVYGTDGVFRRQLQRVAGSAGVQHLRHIALVRYPREVIPDASTRTLERRSPVERAKRDAALAARRSVPPVQFVWSQVYAGEAP